MKKLLTGIIALVVASSIQAQHASFGIKAGVNIASLKGEDNSTDSKVGLHAGGLAHIHLSKRWAIQPEVLYSSQGGKQDILNNTQKINLDYINIPVLFQFMFDNGFRLQAGPQVGFLVNAKSKLGSATTDIKDAYKTVDFSLPIGLGYLTSSGIGIDGRWVPGLSNISEGSGDVKNNVFQIGLFYQFGGSRHKRK